MKFKKGDRVRVVRDTKSMFGEFIAAESHGTIKNIDEDGDIFVVLDCRADYVDLGIRAQDLELESLADEPRQYKAGDVVRVINDDDGRNPPIGTELAVLFVKNQDELYWRTDADNEASDDYAGFVYVHEVEHVRSAEPVKAAKTPPVMVFSEISNDEAGQELIAAMRKHLNRDGYTMRVRGQHLKPGLDWRKYQMGQPIDKSTHLRVYINRKSL